MTDEVDRTKEYLESLRWRPSVIELQSRLTKMLPEGTDVPEEALSVELAGRRCVLLQDRQSSESEGKYGAKIIIPETARQPLGAGWIINIGHEWALAGQPEDRSTFYGLFPNRWEVIGQKVLFGDWVGQDLNFDLTERRFQSRFKVLSEHEIWGLVERR